jgi:tyrosine-protein phosphatase SIW14
MSLGLAVRATGVALLSILTIGQDAGSAQNLAPAPDSGRVAGTHLKAKGIPNFGEVSPSLYRGGVPSAMGIEELKKKGIDVVVDLRGHSQEEEARVTKLGMKYVAIPSHCPFPDDKPFAKFLQVVEENPGKKVFVHCRLGDDRTGMAVASYRMAEQGWSADQAMKEMQAFGFTRVHHAICPGMADYEEKFPERLKSSPAFRGLAQRQTEPE